MCREGSASQTDDAAGLDAVEDSCAIPGNLGHERIGQVDALCPLVTLDGNLHMEDIVAGDILAGSDGLDLAAHRGMDVGGNESAGLGDQLAGLDAVAHGDNGLGRGAEMLGH